MKSFLIGVPEDSALSDIIWTTRSHSDIEIEAGVLELVVSMHPFFTITPRRLIDNHATIRVNCPQIGVGCTYHACTSR